jgi:hypothetical protein
LRLKALFISSLVACGGTSPQGHATSSGTIGGFAFSATEAWLSSSSVVISTQAGDCPKLSGGPNETELALVFPPKFAAGNGTFQIADLSQDTTKGAVFYIVNDAKGDPVVGMVPQASTGSTGTVTITSNNAQAADGTFDLSLGNKRSDGTILNDHVTGTFHAVHCK